MKEILRYQLLILLCCFSVDAFPANSMQNNLNISLQSSQAEDSLTLKKSFYLPEWFSFVSDSNQKYITLLGISDPGLDKKLAEEQALFRLKAMISMMSKSEISGMNQFFSKFHEELRHLNHLERQSKFIQLHTLSSRQTIFPDQITIMDSTTTIFGEKILLAKYPLDPIEDIKAEVIDLAIDIFEIEYGKQLDFSSDVLIWMKCSIHSDSSTYKIYKQDELCAINSTLNNEEIPFKEDYYKYFSHIGLKPNHQSNTSKLFYGLWKAYLENICLSVSRNMLLEAVKVRNVSEIFGQDENKIKNSSSIRDITQEVSLKNTRFSIKEIGIGENMLWLDLEFNKNLQ